MRTRIACLSLALWLAAGAAAAQENGRGTDRSLENLIQDARLAPAEFEADALLRIAQSPKIGEARRRELLIEAFMRAYGAQESVRRISFGVPPESREGAQTLALDSRLTRISLQTRATQMLAIVDPARARELFEWISPGIEATPCESVLVPALDEYYTTLSMLARTAFPASERPDALRFLEFHLWRAQLPSEMPAVAMAVQRFNARVDEAQYLETLLRFVLEGGVRDPRGFSVSGMDLVTKFGELEDADRERGITGLHLLSAVRGYLKAQLTGPRCGDSPTEAVTVETFNARNRRTAAYLEGIPFLSPSDVRPARLLPTARLTLYWQTAEARRLLDDYLQLRGRQRQPVAERIRQTKEWQEQAGHLVTDLEQWTGSREASESDYFYEKSRLLTDLLALMPPGTVRTRGIRSFVDFLRHTDARQRHTLWFVFANRLLELARGADRDFVLDTLDATRHPVLSLYARLERVLPEPRSKK